MTRTTSGRRTAVYVVMFLLAGYLLLRAGWSNIDLNLSDHVITGWSVLPVMLTAIANFLVFALLVVMTAAATKPVFGELIDDPGAESS